MPDVFPSIKLNERPITTPPHSHGRLSLGGRIATLLGVSIPLVGLVVAVCLLWGWGVHWFDLGLLLGMYSITVLGVGIGFHRLFVHRSFETYIAIKVILVALGSMALQGTMIHWVGLHRWHHQHSDLPDDVHSPHHRGKGILGFLAGFWHSHIGWAFKADPPGLNHYVQDLRQSQTLRIASALFPLWVALGLVIPTILGGIVSGTWSGAGTAFLWGGLVRIFLVHHVTWSVNSVCHIWGQRPYRSEDDSRNNILFGLLAFGEGWHNTHHAFPTSARHGLTWWQIDISYWVIYTLASLGLAWNVKLPSAESQLRERNIT